jgi:hypothetical protein
LARWIESEEMLIRSVMLEAVWGWVRYSKDVKSGKLIHFDFSVNLHFVAG